MKNNVLCAITKTVENNKTIIIPLINHLHNDLESGQIISHYHADTRYHGEQDLENYEIDYPYFRITENQFELKWFELKLHNDKYQAITPKRFIQLCKLNGNKLIDGKCVHKGFNLSEVKDVNGVIVCPLHGLKYSVKSKKLVKQ